MESFTADEWIEIDAQVRVAVDEDSPLNFEEGEVVQIGSQEYLVSRIMKLSKVFATPVNKDVYLFEVTPAG